MQKTEISFVFFLFLLGSNGYCQDELVQYEWTAEMYLEAVKTVDEHKRSDSALKADFFKPIDRINTLHWLKVHYMLGKAPIENFSHTNMMHLFRVVPSEPDSTFLAKMMAREGGRWFRQASKISQLLLKLDIKNDLPTLSTSAIKSVFYGLPADSLEKLHAEMFDKNWRSMSNLAAVEFFTAAVYALGVVTNDVKKKSDRLTILYTAIGLFVGAISIKILAHPSEALNTFVAASGLAFSAISFFTIGLKARDVRESVGGLREDKGRYEERLKRALKVAMSQGYSWKRGVHVPYLSHLLVCYL